MRVVVCLIAIRFIFSSLPSIAQTEEPTLKETLEWIKNKMNNYGEGWDYCSVGVGGEAVVNQFYVLKKECEESGYRDGDKVGEHYVKTTSLSLYNVTSFRIKDFKVTFYANDKSVTSIQVYDDNSRSQVTETSVSFGMKFDEEENLEERFKKALNRLVYFNTKDKPKETF